MHLNKIYLEAESKKKYRVIYEDIDFCMLMDTDKNSLWPVKIHSDLLVEPEYTIVDEVYILPEIEDNSKAAKARDEALSSISYLLDNYSLLFDNKPRNKLIQEQMSKTGKSRVYIIRQLRKYWQRGMVPNALAPNYVNCGTSSIRKLNTKQGRKRTKSKGDGILVTDEIKEIFESAITDFYFKNDKVTLVNAYTKSISLYKSRYPNIDETEIPTLAQFKYYYKTNHSEQAALKARSSSIVYNKDIQPLSSTSAYTIFGPGARYEIDATTVDLYLVSENKRDNIIGRPTIYYVKDVFTRMVVGLYVGLENPSWATAGMALANAFSDKVKYCEEFDIHIDSTEWPSVGLPATVTADRGEMLGTQADVLVNQLGVTLSITRAHRGSDKGIVERAFREMHASIKPYAEGVVEPLNGMKRTGHRYELDAELSLYDFTQIVIYHVIEHNTSHVISKYDFAPDMPADLPSIPVQLWNWGIQHRTGRLRTVDAKLIRISLLPQGKGTVSPNGVRFKGIYYTSPEMIKQGWLHRSNTINRPRTVKVSYDPRNTNIIYLRPDKSEEPFWECAITPRSRRYQDMTFAEAKGILDQQNKTQAVHKQTEDLVKADYQDKINDVIKKARKKKSDLPPATKTERLRGIQDNRQEELQQERQKERDKLTTADAHDELALVVPINTSIDSDSLDYPSLDEFIEDDFDE